MIVWEKGEGRRDKELALLRKAKAYGVGDSYFGGMTGLYCVKQQPTL